MSPVPDGRPRVPTTTLLVVCLVSLAGVGVVWSQPTAATAAGEFTVGEFDAPDGAVQGGELTVSALVTNTAEVTGTQVVEYRFAPDSMTFRRGQEVTLEPGEQRRLTFEVRLREDTAAGSYEHGVFTANDSVTATIDIRRPNFSVSAVEAPDDDWDVRPDATNVTRQGEQVTVSAAVTNTEPQAVTGDVEVAVDFERDGRLTGDDVLGSREVTLDGDETRRVSFTFDVPTDQEPDLYQVRVTSGEARAFGSFVVHDDEPTSGRFGFSGSMPSEWALAQGERFVPGIDVINPTDTGATQIVDFRVDPGFDAQLPEGATVDRRLVTLGAGIDSGVNVPWTVPEDLDPGFYTWGFVTSDETQYGNLVVYDPDAPPSYRLSGPDGADTVEAGAQSGYQVGASVANVGGESETATLELRVDLDRDGTLEPDEVVDSISREATPGTVYTERLEWDLPADTPAGEYRYGVFVGDVSGTGVVTVTSTETPTPTPTPSPDFVFTGSGPLEGTVQPGETYRFGYDVANLGNVTDTQWVETRVDFDRDGEFEADERVDRRELTLKPGVDEGVGLSIDLSESLEPGRYEWEAFTEADRTGQVFVVEAPAEPAFTFTGSGPNEGQVEAGEEFLVGYDIANTGESAGSQLVEVRVDFDQDGTFEDEETVDSREFTLEPGIDTGASVTIQVPESLSPGEYDWVAIAGTERVGHSFTVERAATATATPVPTSSPTPTPTAEPADGDGGDGGSGGSGGGGSAGRGSAPAAEPSASIVVRDATLASETVAVGTPVSVRVEVENEGDAAGEFTARLSLDGTELAASDPVTVAPSETRTVRVNATLSEVGTYDLGVNGFRTWTVSVEAAPTRTATPSPSPSSTPTPASDAPTETATVTGAPVVAETAMPGGEGTVTPTVTGEIAEATASPATTAGDGPGFGMVAALLALVAGLVVIGRRKDR